MENESTFNLSNALDRWRNSLSDQALAAEEIEELESHLLETMRSLQSEKLSPAEAFLVAEHRVGGPETIGEQFRLAKPLAVWKRRGLWMVSGVLLFLLAGALANLASVVTLLIGNQWTSSGFVLGTAGLGVQGLVVCLAGVLLWRVLQSRRFLQMNGVAFGKLFLGLLLGVIALGGFNFVFSSWAAARSSPLTLGAFYMIRSGYSAALPVVVLGILGGWLCWKARREQIVCSILCGSLLLGCSAKESQSQATHATQPSATSSTPMETSLTLAKDSPAKAADEFMKIDFADERAPLFSKGSPLSYSEVEFIKLPREVNERLAKQAQDDLAIIKRIVAEIKARRDEARAAGKSTLVQQYNAQLEKFGARLQQPGNLAITQIVGKSVGKVASQ